MNTNILSNERANKQLIPFLRELADSIEDKKLLPEQLQQIGEFFMSYKFHEQALKDNNGETDSFKHPSFDRDEMIKFLCMGWYVYCVLLKNDTVSVQEQKM